MVSVIFMFMLYWGLYVYMIDCWVGFGVVFIGCVVGVGCFVFCVGFVFQYLCFDCFGFGVDL